MSALRTLLITGASGAIGSALAREFAAPGVRLVLQGRNQTLLQVLAADCEEKGALVEWAAFDVRDHAYLRTWASALVERFPLDMLILNAGRNTHVGQQGEGESWEQVQALLEVNLMAALVLVDAVLPALRKRGCGQIVFISSLAAYFGLPVTPSYCASKAALKAYGEALRGWLAPEGIWVNVVMPGYIHSEMCAAMPGPKPFLRSPEYAASLIRKGLARNKARISFPFPLNLGTWFLAVLPAALSQRIVCWLGYGRPHANQKGDTRA